MVFFYFFVIHMILIKLAAFLKLHLINKEVDLGDFLHVDAIPKKKMNGLTILMNLV